jgi:hypothetical protein
MHDVGDLSGAERRTFEELVRVFHEFDAYEPERVDGSAVSAPVAPGPSGVKRWWRRLRTDH